MRSKIPFNLLLKGLLKSPDLIVPISKGLLRKHLGINQDYKNVDGIAIQPPLQISLRITNACNHRCAVCGQYGKNGYMKGEKGKELLKNLPIENYKKLVDEVADYKPLFYVTGGEPFLYPDLAELLNYIKKKECIVTLVTNGVLLEKNTEEIVKNKWDMVLVSFDGPEEIHDKCRNLNGAYNTAVKSLLKLKEMKEKCKSAKPFIFTYTTISQVNAPFLEETFKIGEIIKPDLFIISPSWFTSEEIGLAQTKLYQEELGITPFTWKSYVNKFSEEDAKLFEEKILQVKKKKWSFNYIFIPDLKKEAFREYYLHPENFFGYCKCAAPFLMVDVMPNGDVVTCRDYIDVKVGNITEKPLLEIWNGPEFVKFRKLLISKGGTFPICSRCCGLMGF